MIVLKAVKMVDKKKKTSERSDNMVMKTNKTKKPNKKELEQLGLTTIKTELVKVKPAMIAPAGKVLSEVEKMMIYSLALGETEEDVIKKFNITRKEFLEIKSNPDFVSTLNEKIMSTGVASKMERISKKKRITERLYGRMLELINDDNEMAKLGIEKVARLLQEFEASLEKQLGEDNDKQQNLNILIMEVVKKNTGKEITNMETYTPDMDFPVFELNGSDVTELRPDHTEDE